MSGLRRRVKAAARRAAGSARSSRRGLPWALLGPPAACPPRGGGRLSRKSPLPPREALLRLRSYGAGRMRAGRGGPGSAGPLGAGASLQPRSRSGTDPRPLLRSWALLAPRGCVNLRPGGPLRSFLPIHNYGTRGISLFPGLAFSDGCGQPGQGRAQGGFACGLGVLDVVGDAAIPLCDGKIIGNGRAFGP